MSVSVTTSQAQSGISQELRNNIYSALLSGDGIRNIETTLDECLRSTGFRDNLKTYITFLFRSGQATTAEEAYRLAMDKIREHMRDASAELSNGTNGTHGSTNGNGDAADADVDLKIPKEAISKGTKVVMKELEKVCDMTYEDDK